MKLKIYNCERKGSFFWEEKKSKNDKITDVKIFVFITEKVAAYFSIK